MLHFHISYRKNPGDGRWENPAWTQHSPMLRQKAECFFWYRLTRVVPEQRPLNGCCCWLLVSYFMLIRIVAFLSSQIRSENCWCLFLLLGLVSFIEDLHCFVYSQLYNDGHPNLAASLAKLTNTQPNCPPSDRLLHIVSLGLQTERGL